MPVFLVCVNGYGRPEPQLLSLVTSEPTAADALDLSLEDFDGRITDIEVECLSPRSDCWYQQPSRYVV